VKRTEVRVPVSEADFQRQVIDLALTLGYRVAHFRPGQTSRKDHNGKAVWVTPMCGDPGWPDLILCRPPRLIIVELKSEKGKVSPEQEIWLAQLNQCSGVEVRVWRPSVWDNIVDDLK